MNPSGGLISKGHPLGATGVAQCAELNWQLRGECGPRQVKGAKVALQHNLGLGGNVVVTAYRIFISKMNITEAAACDAEEIAGCCAPPVCPALWRCVLVVMTLVQLVKRRGHGVHPPAHRSIQCLQILCNRF